MEEKDQSRIQRDVLDQAMAFASDFKRMYEDERKKAEELEAAQQSLVIAIKKLEDAQKTREEFIQNCSHELRTPLVPILGWASLMKQRELGREEIVQFAGIIEHSGHRLLAIIESLIDTADIQRRTQRPQHHTPIELADLFAEVSRSALESGVDLSLEVEPDLTIRSDRQVLRKVLGNLLDNARKFAGHSIVALTATREDVGDVTIRIVDHGPGIPEGDRQDAFDPFKQLDGGTTRDQGGLGLGLYLARELTRSLGGDMWIESTPSGGTTIAFSIPQRREDDPIV